MLIIVLIQILLMVDSVPKKKVIVVGAGFSGLSVAYHLKNECFDVEILEARDRIGGRVHPYDLSGSTVDLGGQWVHEASKNNPIRQLMEHHNIPFQREGPIRLKKNALFDEHGKEISKSTSKAAMKVYNDALNNYHEKDVDLNTSYRDLLDKALLSANMPSSDELTRVINYKSHRTECYEGGRLNELSVYLDELYQNLGGPDEYPEGGYNEVLKAVAGKIGMERIRLSCVVDSIAYESTSRDGIVTLTLGDGQVIKGDFCVCSVPLGVLQKRKLVFSPPLPNTRLAAIDAIGMGLLDKVVLKFDKRFWCYENFSVSNTDPTRVKTFYDCTDEVGAPLLVMFLGGDAARRIDAPDGLSDEAAVSEAMETLRLVFGKDVVLDPVASKVTRWNLDPFAFGAYSFTKVGCKEMHYDEVGTPVGNLLFAGEHTSKISHSTVHGAWMTGQREANRLARWHCRT